MFYNFILSKKPKKGEKCQKDATNSRKIQKRHFRVFSEKHRKTGIFGKKGF